MRAYVNVYVFVNGVNVAYYTLFVLDIDVPEYGGISSVCAMYPL